MALTPLANYDAASISIDFPSLSQWDAPFHHCIAYDYSHADWDDFCDHLGDVPWGGISLNLVLNVASGLRLELMYLSLILNIRSSLTHFHGFQLLVLLLQFMEVTFFGLHQPHKSSKSKINF